MGRTSFQNNQLIKNDNLYFKVYIIDNGQKNAFYLYIQIMPSKFEQRIVYNITIISIL